MSRHPAVTEESLAELVPAFYARVRLDPVIGPVFDAAIDDWPHHLAKLTDFWISVMLGVRRFEGRPMQSHARHPIEEPMFDRWLALWRETVRERFEPEPADALIERAELIGRSLRFGLFFRADAAERRAHQ